MRTFGLSRARGRRSVPRANTPLVAVLSMPSGDCPAALVDISRTGARLRGQVLPGVGHQVIFSAESVRVTAEVVWYETGTCAVEFDTPIAAYEVQHLRGLSLEPASR